MVYYYYYKPGDMFLFTEPSSGQFLQLIKGSFSECAHCGIPYCLQIVLTLKIVLNSVGRYVMKKIYIYNDKVKNIHVNSSPEFRIRLTSDNTRITATIYRMFNLKLDRILIRVIYLLRFTTCYITQQTYIYSKCWK